MLSHLYGGNIVRDKPADVVNNLFLFDQKEFFPNQNPRNVSIDNLGYVYIPVLQNIEPYLKRIFKPFIF